MSKPFDASPKDLLQLRPADRLAFLGVAARSVEVVDSDGSTVTAAADKVLLVRADDGDRIQHFDFQSEPDASVPRRGHLYSALLHERHKLPVESVVVLLAPKANLRDINGVYEQRLPGETEPYLRFRYRVIRVWQLPLADVLRAGLGVLPLAPLSDVPRTQLPAVITEMEQRLEAEPDRDTVGKLWAAAGVLLGLRYDKGFVHQLLSGVRAMRESTFFAAFVDEARVAQLREDIQRLGERKFRSPPPPPIRAAIEGLADLAQLNQTLDRILDADTWEALLVPPSAPSSPHAPAPTPRRRKKS